MNTIYAQNPDYLFMVEQATKAPSGHNTQPWLFKINETNIRIYPDFKKSLPVVDPDNRELFISIGCAVENLCISACKKGYSTEISIAENGVITIRLDKDKLKERDPLFEQIAVRQTDRSEYNGKIIPEDTLSILKSITVEQGIDINFYQNGTSHFDSVLNYVVKGNAIQMQDKAFKDELKSWMRFNKKQQNRTNNGLSYAVFNAPNIPALIAKPIMVSYLNAKTQNKGDIKKIQSASHLVLFTINQDNIKEWINLGRVLQRLLLKATELGISNSYFNQPNEIRSLSVEMANSLNICEIPAILLRIGYGKKMPYSKRIDVSKLIME